MITNRRQLGAFLASTLVSFPLFAQKAGSSTMQDQPRFSYTSTGKMNTYRNLAQLAYEFYLKGDDDKAAVVGRIIEKVFDKSEGDLEKSSPEVYAKIDMSMDAFIKPLMYYTKSGRPDPVKERKFFDEYLQNLALAD